MRYSRCRLIQAIHAGEIDFHCITCGYNLRGLKGNAKCCPECGQIMDLRELPIESKEVKKAINAVDPIMIITRTLVVTVVYAIVAFAPLVYAVQDGFSWSSELWIPLLSILPPSLAVALLGIRSIRRYIRGCRRVRLPRDLAIRFLWEGLAIVVCGLLGVISCFWLTKYYVKGDNQYIISSILAILVILATSYLFRVYRDKLSRYLERAILDYACLIYLRQRIREEAGG